MPALTQTILGHIVEISQHRVQQKNFLGYIFYV